MAVGAVVLINQSSPATPVATPPATGTSGATTPSATTAPSTPASGTGAQASMAQVFPDSSSANCQQVDVAANPLRTQGGALATEVYYCDYASIAPGARVIFARWADAAGARSWLQDTQNLGPRIEEFDVWRAGQVEQGPLYTAQSNGTVYSTGIYEDLPFSWEIRTSTLDQSNQVFEQLRFTPRASFGG
jgi:serine/threonine-protein kinase